MQILAKIGILGGTFNPIHHGHLILTQNAIDAFDLSKVLMIPCAVPPHKRVHDLIPANHRLDMLEMGTEGDFRLEVANIEVKRGEISYAIDTVHELQAIYKQAELYFIIGADTLTELHLWKDIDELVTLCRFVSFERPGFEIGNIKPEDLHLDMTVARQLVADITRGCSIEISSSDIRHRIAEGMNIRYLVPPAVEMYIAEHSLYQP